MKIIIKRYVSILLAIAVLNVLRGAVVYASATRNGQELALDLETISLEDFMDMPRNTRIPVLKTMTQKQILRLIAAETIYAKEDTDEIRVDTREIKLELERALNRLKRRRNIKRMGAGVATLGALSGAYLLTRPGEPESEAVERHAQQLAAERAAAEEAARAAAERAAAERAAAEEGRTSGVQMLLSEEEAIAAAIAESQALYAASPDGQIEAASLATAEAERPIAEIKYIRFDDGYTLIQVPSLFQGNPDQTPNMCGYYTIYNAKVFSVNSDIVVQNLQVPLNNHALFESETLNPLKAQIIKQRRGGDGSMLLASEIQSLLPQEIVDQVIVEGDGFYINFNQNHRIYKVSSGLEADVVRNKKTRFRRGEINFLVYIVNEREHWMTVLVRRNEQNGLEMVLADSLGRDKTTDERLQKHLHVLGNDLMNPN